MSVGQSSWAERALRRPSAGHQRRVSLLGAILGSCHRNGALPTMRITQEPDIGDDMGECVVGSLQYEEIVQWLLVMGDDMNQYTPIYSGLSSCIVSYVRRFGAPPCESLWEWVKG